MAQNQHFFPGISEDDKRECHNIFQAGGMEALGEYWKRKFDEWEERPLNVGVIGSSGSGKSSLINAIRGLTTDDEGAAEVGSIGTITQPTPYAHPNNELLKFWDLPSVPPNFPKEGYLQRISFDQFDLFLIITHSRFTENDKWLANEISKEGKQFFIVRTKTHLDLENDKHAHPKTHHRETVLAEIRANLRENLGALYDDRKLFLIDNHKRGMYDFDTLEQRIIEDFSSIKREALIHSLKKLSEEVVKMKAETLKNRIWITSLASAATAAVPIPGTSIATIAIASIDMLLILAQSQYYFSQLGLDETSLKRTASVVSCDGTVLKRIVEESVGNLLTTQGIIVFIKAIPAATLSFTVEGISLVGTAVASGFSFATTNFILHIILRKMTNLALLVVNTAIDNSALQL